MHGAHGKLLQIAGKTQHLNLQWGEARRRACFIVIIGLESPSCLIGMDIMRQLLVRIDVTNGTATPAQPDPQTIHLKGIFRLTYLNFFFFFFFFFLFLARLMIRKHI